MSYLLRDLQSCLLIFHTLTSTTFEKFTHTHRASWKSIINSHNSLKKSSSSNEKRNKQHKTIKKGSTNSWEYFFYSFLRPFLVAVRLQTMLYTLNKEISFFVVFSVEIKLKARRGSKKTVTYGTSFFNNNKTRYFMIPFRLPGCSCEPAYYRFLSVLEGDTDVGTQQFGT